MLPDVVRVVVDDAFQARECNESNNELESDVEAGQPLAEPDEEIEERVSTPLRTRRCPPPCATPLASASNYVVRYYAGDPEAGGNVLHEVTRPGPLGLRTRRHVHGGDCHLPAEPRIPRLGRGRPGQRDWDGTDGNNKDDADSKVMCGGVH